jgi:CRP-like cAMP-binding protein
MSDLFERVWMLKRTPLFANVDSEDLKSVAQELEEESLVAGERLFEPGEPGDRAYFIARGRIGISRRGDASPDEMLSTIGVNECFGELSLLDERPRDVAARVLEDATLLSLDRQRFRTLVERHPPLVLGLLRSLGARLRGIG